LAACDVLIVGAGPAGAVAGVVLARAGVRVRIVDRAAFPRDKLCGDTLNPGTMTRLRALGLAEEIDRRGLRVDGMILSGERGVVVDGRYPCGRFGRALLRRELDSILLQHAIVAGCAFDAGVAVRGARVGETRGGPTVTGVSVGVRGAEQTIDAPVTIAADGRRSTIVFGLGLARHPERPRRWAIGGYFDGARSGSDGGPGPRQTPKKLTFGEMHVRRNCYIGVAPVPGGLTNVCLVRPSGPADRDLADAASLLTRTLAADPLLRDRFDAARLVGPPVVLGPLAVDVQTAAIPGLLLAGDAAGFIDPMTGDGLRFAVQGGELAAQAAIRALEHGWQGVHTRLDAERREAFTGKWRFNRALRTLVASPRGVEAAAFAARIAPGVLRGAIARAGDCDLAVEARRGF
jgi:menaquinone-9 beta-reductase